ncbi:ras-related protein Rab-17 [Pelodytes ibericus]
MEQCLTSPTVMPYERQEVKSFKLVLLGSSDVGKSSMAIRYVKNEFQDIAPTTGCAFFSQRVVVQGRPLEFAIWDTAGQERYHSVCHLYYRGARAALLVYDITQKETFSRAQLWLEELEKYFASGEVIICLIGNKSDLQAERKVTREEGQDFAEKKGLVFMEVSARTGDNVREVFEAVAYEMLIQEFTRQERQHWREPEITIQEETFISHRGSGCCKS